MKKLALTLSFAALALLALAQTVYPLVITKVEIRDYAGNLRTVFNRGEIVMIVTEISIAPTYYYVAPISYLQIITMWHGNRMLGVLLTRATIATGEMKTFGGGILIRPSDPIGTYTIEVYAWNGFPSEMGAAWRDLAELEEATFTIRG